MKKDIKNYHKDRVLKYVLKIYILNTVDNTI